MLDLCTLSEGLPAISPEFGKHLAHAGAVCLESQGHEQGTGLQVRGLKEEEHALQWPAVTDQIQRGLNDPEDATEHGALGIAILLIKMLVGYSVILRSRRGTGFDYWLGDTTSPPFQDKARLEVSGIRRGDDKLVKNRVSQKLKQTNASDNSGLSAYVVVVEFGRPLADVRQK